MTPPVGAQAIIEVSLVALAGGVGAESRLSGKLARREDNPMAENGKRKFGGWGYEDQGSTPEQQKHMAERMAKRFGLGSLELTAPPKESELNLRAPRVKPPSALDAICSTATHERAGHTYGKGSRDIRRAFRRDYTNPIDIVAFPRDEKELIQVLEWCDGAQIAAVTCV